MKNQINECSGLPEFRPEWMTTEEYAGIRPICLLHREQEEGPVPDGPENVHILARASFLSEEKTSTDVSNSIRSARWILRISADDHYQLYLNGKFCGLGPAPSWPQHYYYNELELKPEWFECRNALAVHLYYQGKINRVHYSGDGRCALAGELLRAADGIITRIPLIWRYQNVSCYSGETTGYDTQFLENFDGRKWEENWTEPEFDDSHWRHMVQAEWADYRMFRQPTEMLQIYETSPAMMMQRKSGKWFADMGAEVTGSLILSAEGKEGDRVVVRCGEECLSNGNVRFEMRCGCRYDEVWTLKEGKNTWEQYDYKGFRFVEITADPDVKITKISVRNRHYPMDPSRVRLQTDSEDLNRIFHICSRGIMLGTQDGYLDCPTREKGQYLGDAVITSRGQVWLTGKTDMLRKCIEQFAMSAEVDPGLMAVVPGGLMQEIADFSLLFPELLLTDYEFTGDISFLRCYEPVVADILGYFRRYERGDGMLDQVADKWNLVDWPENLRDHYDFELTRPIVGAGVHNVMNALYLGCIRMYERIRAILGYAPVYDFERYRDAFQRSFYREDLKLFVDSEQSTHASIHSNLYALYFGLVPEGAVADVCTYLGKRGLECGVFTAYFLLRGLARAGRRDIMYQLLTNRSEHGWIQMLREGASTCFEAWGAEQKWNTSLCHPWASGPVPLIIEEIAGIHPDPEEEYGFRFDAFLPEELGKVCLRIPFRGRTIVIRRTSAGQQPFFKEALSLENDT